MKKVYIKPGNKVYTVKMCTPIAVSVQGTTGAAEMEENESFGARENSSSTSSNSVWSGQW